MSDIVERLLRGIDSYGDTGIVGTQAGLIREAASEITRLRAQVAEQEATIRRLQDRASKDAETFGERVRAAVEAEREACAKAAEWAGARKVGGGDGGTYATGTALDAARAIRNRTEGGE